MKTLFSQSAVLFALVFGAQSALSQTEPQVITLPLSHPGKPVTLGISIHSARIEVIGEDRQDAEVTVTAADSGQKIITPSGAKTLLGGGYQLDVKERDNHIEVNTDSIHNKVTIVARIPRQADLDLATVNHGEIVVSNITGKLELRNVNGPITADNISGSIIAESVNKPITVSFNDIVKQSVTSISSINGPINLSIPSKAGVELWLDSARGEIVSDFEVEVKPSKPVITRNTRSNGVSVQVENTIVATINGGGPVIKLKTLNGDIQIGKSDK